MQPNASWAFASVVSSIAKVCLSALAALLAGSYQGGPFGPKNPLLEDHAGELRRDPLLKKNKEKCRWDAFVFSHAGMSERKKSLDSHPSLPFALTSPLCPTAHSQRPSVVRLIDLLWVCLRHFLLLIKAPLFISLNISTQLTCLFNHLNLAYINSLRVNFFFACHCVHMWAFMSIR